jgi:hypothetical protein
MFQRILVPLCAAAVMASSPACAETADEKALIIQLDEAHKRSLRLTLVGDVDGLKQQVPAIENLLLVANLSRPCQEATRAKLAAAQANISFLESNDSDGQLYFHELQKQDRLFHDYRRECLDGRMEP